GRYCAAHYDELVDCPVEMGQFWSGHFHAGGIPHRLVVSGAAPSFDGERLLQDAQRICATCITFWHGTGTPPIGSYLFLLNAVDDGYGGLEHRNSTALIAARRDLPQRAGVSGVTWKPGDGYTTLLGLISHEYFHTWNVKRLRPAEFEHYDYTAENYTELLWFFEGFTSYYDDLLLVRAGLLEPASYLKLLGKTITQVLQTPGRLLQSLGQSSFDAWVKYYRQDENTPNATVSYYTKGALVALCLDLTLRREGLTTLDAVMRALWLRCQAGPMLEADLLAVLHELGGRSYAQDIAAWAHSTQELPLAELLAVHGVQMQRDAPQVAQRLGLRVAGGDGVRLKVVLRGGLAERAGMAAGDEWLGIETPTGAWRLQKLDDLTLYTPPDTREIVALVARDQRLLRLPLQTT
ncbi:MAG: M61 family metallopeptidase, partial [Giesbergeria sp.]